MRVEMEVLEENTELGTATLKISFDKLETPGDYVNGTMLVMLSSGGDMDERIEVQLDNVIPRAATNAYYNGAISRWLWFAESDNRQNYDIILNGFSYRTSGVEFILNYSYIIQIEGAKTTETSDDKVTWSNGSGSGMFGEVNFTVDMITPVVRSYSAGGYIQGEYRFFAPAINPNFTVKHSLNSIAVSSKDGNIYTYPF